MDGSAKFSGANAAEADFFRAPRRAYRSMSRAVLPIRTSSPSAAITTPIR